jgi:hypothetical protein
MQNMMVVIIGFIIILILVAIFGTKLLIDFSLFLEKFQNNGTASSDASQQTDTYIAPPTLDPVITATNSAQIAISGFGTKDQTIQLYLNDQRIDQTTVDGNNKFQFPSVTLKQGQNNVTVKAVTNSGKESANSNTDTISYLNKPPSLTISKPQDGQGFSKSSTPTVTIEGTTDATAKVTVNGFWAIVDAQGNYNYLYTLNDGDNDIKVIATDDAGNQTTKEIHIHTQ